MRKPVYSTNNKVAQALEAVRARELTALDPMLTCLSQQLSTLRSAEEKLADAAESLLR